MLILVIGSMMLLALLVGIYIGLNEKYNASEGTCALLVLETFFVGIGLLVYGLTQIF